MHGTARRWDANGAPQAGGTSMWVKYTIITLFSLPAIATFDVLTVKAVGQDIEAQVQSCAACHGQNGIPADPKTTPIIWGQTEYYIVRQLQSYKKGNRQNSV